MGRYQALSSTREYFSMLPIATPVDFRNAIADAIAVNEKSYDVPSICTSLGLEAGTPDEAFSSKRVYVRTRLVTKNLDDLANLGEQVLTRYPNAEELLNLVNSLKSQGKGVAGGIKNLIFAANGPKPELIIIDALNNTVEIAKNEEHCLIYDLPISHSGLLWQDLVHWWSEKNGLISSDKATEHHLYKRLLESLSSPPEKAFFKSYFKHFHAELTDQLPALIPQVYMHYDPKTLKELKGQKRLVRQRMDFLLLLPNNERIVIEIDGVQHYSNSDKTANPKKYAEMVAEDRRLRLLGYEMYRFGGYELTNTDEQESRLFLSQLFTKHRITKRVE